MKDMQNLLFYLDIAGDSLKLTLNSVIGKCIAILGIRGSGKTNTATVLVEELLSKSVPLSIVDIDGEYWGLQEKYDIVRIGASDDADIPLTLDEMNKASIMHLASTLAELSLKEAISLILDLSEFIGQSIDLFLLAFSRTLWEVSRKVRRPYFIIIEEAHEFIPQGPGTPLKEYLTRIALRGRKRGLGLILVSQRSAKVDKDVLTQAELLFLHKVVHPADLRVYKELLSLSSSEVYAIVPKLKVGEAIFYYQGRVRKIRIRKQKTFHAGYTPIHIARKSVRIRNLKEYILSYLKKKLIESEAQGKHMLSLNKTRYEPCGLSKESKMLYDPLLLSHTFKLAFKVQYELARILSNSSKSLLLIFKILESEYPNWLSYKDLEILTGYSRATLYSVDLSKFLRLNLIKKRRIGREIKFRSNLKEFIERRVKDSSLCELIYKVLKDILLDIV